MRIVLRMIIKEHNDTPVSCIASLEAFSNSGSIGEDCFTKHGLYSGVITPEQRATGGKQKQPSGRAVESLNVWITSLTAGSRCCARGSRPVGSQSSSSIPRGADRQDRQTNPITCLPATHAIPTVCSDRKRINRTRTRFLLLFVYTCVRITAENRTKLCS